MTELRYLACRRRLASAKLLKSRYTASGRPASSNKTSNTKTKLIQELFTFFIVQPVHDSSQSSAQDGPSATDCRWRNAKASWLACAADYLFSHRGADFRGRRANDRQHLAVSRRNLASFRRQYRHRF